MLSTTRTSNLPYPPSAGPSETEIVLRIGESSFSVYGNDASGWALALGDLSAVPFRYGSVEEVVFALLNFMLATEVSS